MLNRHALTLSPEEGPEISVTFPGTLRDRIGLLATNIVFVQFSALGLIAFLLRYHKISWSAAFGRITDRPHLGPANSVRHRLRRPRPWPAFGVAATDHRLGRSADLTRGRGNGRRASAPPELALQALSVVVMAPICEELLFRGVIYPSLRDLGHPRLAIAASSLLFAAIHGSLALMLPLTVLAVILVWLYEKSGSIVAPILMHAAFNAVNFAMIKLLPQIAQ